nr:glycosyl hydrolase [Edaphobacter modestus]
MPAVVAVPRVVAQSHASGQASLLDRGFRTPPAAARPWVFWMWLRVKSNRTAITADLEAMHAKGIEGAILYDGGVGNEMQSATKMVLGDKGYVEQKTTDFPGAHFSEIPSGPMQSWQPESRELVRWAAQEAGRLGVKLVVTVGLASTSGDIPLEYSQQRLVWSETAVKGPVQFDEVLAEPKTVMRPNDKAVRSMVAERFTVPDVAKYRHEIAVLAVPDRETFAEDDVIDLTNKVDASARLNWHAPTGAWKVMRFAYEPTGMRNAWGLYTDGMSSEALDKTWEATMGRSLSEMTAAERKGLYGVEDDSWEAGPTTWTKLLPAEFARLRGYDLVHWLPALTGKRMGDAGEAAAVRRDYYRTVADVIAENHYAHLGEIAKRNGLKFYSEAAGPNSGQLDPQLDISGVEIPMGEFWVPSPHRPTLDRRFLMRDTASAGHVYGKRLLGCESFTSVGPHWEDSFFEMKNTGDQGFADGCNLIVVHNYSQSPSVTAKPGYVYFAGTHYSRNTTWWDETPAFNAYLGRSAFLLQQGLFVADALYYRGDGIGQIEQRKTEPTLPAEGYDHDNINLDALLHRLTVSDGRLMLPDGMSYRMLVLPANVPMSPEALMKIAGMVRGGAIVVGPKPTGIAGRVLRAEVKREFDATVAELWSDRIEDGKIFSGRAEEALHALKLQPDFEYSGLSDRGTIDWIHRRAGKVDIYFVASKWDAEEKIAATFRVAGRQPELWDPVTGEIRDARSFTQADGRTTVPLEFGPRGSVFVVFRRPISTRVAGKSQSNYPELHKLQELKGSWQVAFDPKWGGPASVTFGSLVDWTKRPEWEIQHYSGAARYTKSFTLAAAPKSNSRIMLDLGEVHEVASVRLNGRDVGVVWTKPARIDITKFAHEGENMLEIKVVNLWPNRLIGDAGLSAEKRLTETNVHKFSEKTPLYPSGLDGPVVLERATY